MSPASRTAVTISSPGAELEARWDEPPRAQGAVVLCHPHPRHGGTMTAPLIHRVAKQLVGDGLAVLRFNFRGVGNSTGQWGGGDGEIEDIAAAVAHVSGRLEPVSVAGWSFGAAAALHWQARSRSTIAYVGIAPPVNTVLAPDLPDPPELADARRLFILGDRDQFTSESELRDYAGTIGARVEMIQGSDHFFHFREERVGALMSAFFSVPA